MYAIRACGPDRINELVRTGATGKQARIAMPAVEDAGAQPCEPTQLLVHDPDADLWVVAHRRVPIPQGYATRSSARFPPRACTEADRTAVRVAPTCQGKAIAPRIEH